MAGGEEDRKTEAEGERGKDGRGDRNGGRKEGWGGRDFYTPGEHYNIFVF